MTDQVSVAVTSREAELVIRLSGEVDLMTIDQCRAEVTSAIDDHLRPKACAGVGERAVGIVVFDLSGLTFLSVGGLRMLAALATRLSRHHVTPVAAVSPTGVIRRIVQLGGLDPEMAIVDAPWRGVPARDATPAAVARSAGSGSEPVRPATADRVPRPRLSAARGASTVG